MGWPISSAPPRAPAHSWLCSGAARRRSVICAAGSAPSFRELDLPRPLVAGWFAAGSAGCLFSSLEGEPTYRYIEVGMES